MGIVTATLFLRTQVHPTSLNGGNKYAGITFFSLLIMLFNGIAGATPPPPPMWIVLQISAGSILAFSAYKEQVWPHVHMPYIILIMLSIWQCGWDSFAILVSNISTEFDTFISVVTLIQGGEGGV